MKVDIIIQNGKDKVVYVSKNKIPIADLTQYDFSLMRKFKNCVICIDYGCGMYKLTDY